MTSKSSKLEFREIVLSHIKKILEIASTELRNKTKVTSTINHDSISEEEDTRKSFCQAIECLSYILQPYFDKQVLDMYQESLDVINAYDYEILEYFKKEVETILEKVEDKEELGQINKNYCINKKIQYAKKLFCELNLLLKRVDYLKSAVYGEGDFLEEEKIADIDQQQK